MTPRQSPKYDGREYNNSGSLDAVPAEGEAAKKCQFLLKLFSLLKFYPVSLAGLQEV